VLTVLTFGPIVNVNIVNIRGEAMPAQPTESLTAQHTVTVDPGGRPVGAPRGGRYARCRMDADLDAVAADPG
jgi:hypothetical protein